MKENLTPQVFIPEEDIWLGDQLILPKGEAFLLRFFEDGLGMMVTIREVNFPQKED